MDRSTIVYAVSTGHAHNLVEEFAKTNVPVAVLLSETPADERERAIEGFRIGTIQVLVNVMVATEGFDLPDASCVVITRPTKSLALFLQMVGRALRPKADGGDCLILDLTGISEIHGTPENRFGNGSCPLAERQCTAIRPSSGAGDAGSWPILRITPVLAAILTWAKSCPRCGRFRLWQTLVPTGRVRGRVRPLRPRQVGRNGCYVGRQPLRPVTTTPGDDVRAAPW